MLFSASLLIAGNVESFLAMNNITPISIDSMDVQNATQTLDEKASFALGQSDGMREEKGKSMFIIGMASGLLISFPAAFICAIAAPGHDAKTVPANANKQAYQKGYHSYSSQMNKTHGFVGGMFGSIAQILAVTWYFEAHPISLFS